MKEYGIYYVRKEVNGECSFVLMDRAEDYSLAQMKAEEKALENGGTFTIFPIYSMAE